MPPNRPVQFRGMLGSPVGWQFGERGEGPDAVILLIASFICSLSAILFTLVSFCYHLNPSPLSLSLSLPHTHINSLPCFFQFWAKQGTQRTENETVISNHHFKSHLRSPHPSLMPQTGRDLAAEKARRNPPNDDYGPLPSWKVPMKGAERRGFTRKRPQPYKNQGVPSVSDLRLGCTEARSQVSRAREPAQRAILSPQISNDYMKF